MKNDFEKIFIKETSNLKQPTIFFLLKNLKYSEAFIKNLRNFPNSIKLNGNFVNIKEKIYSGDLLEISNNPKTKTKIFSCDGNLEILFEDDDYLIVNKPHNLACMPSRSHYSDNLSGQICKYMENKDENFVLRIINRLDKETAGIVTIAKNTIAYNNLKNLDKIYYCLCENKFNLKSQTINTPILTKQINGINIMKREVSPCGKPATTFIRIIKEFENFSLVKAKLETGRTHQIRVHLSSIEHNLLGDSIYGTQHNEKFEKFNIQNHCYLVLKKISFIHFRTQKYINIEIPFPEDWNIFLSDSQ